MKKEEKEKIIEAALQLVLDANKRGISNYRIAKGTNITEKTIGNYVSRGGSPTLVNAKAIISYFENDFQLTGKGERLKEDTVIKNNYPSEKPIYLYDVSAAAGHGSFDVMISEEKVVGEYTVPIFKGADWMIYVKGSSMYPKYSSGDIIACRVLNESKFIQWGKVYVIATKEQGILVKRLRKSEKENCLLAISDNESYDSFDIPLDEITGIALVVGVIRME
jgi:phage repressor protein C with HTH and peptisase S24 domain